jgi:hypothetical protein
VAEVLTVGGGINKMCCNIGTWVRDHLLREAWPNPLRVLPRWDI